MRMEQIQNNIGNIANDIDGLKDKLTTKLEEIEKEVRGLENDLDSMQPEYEFVDVDNMIYAFRFGSPAEQEKLDELIQVLRKHDLIV